MCLLPINCGLDAGLAALVKVTPSRISNYNQIMDNSKMQILTIAVSLIAFCFSPTEGGLKKRHGYEYKQSPSVHFEAPKQEASQEYYEYTQASSHPSSSGSSSSSSDSSSKPSGYSIGSGLRSIAQGSANQAHSAVANQHAAAKQAAFIAKNTLAQHAVQAAATAQAALAGKQVILQELEQQSSEAHRALARELEQLQSAKVAAKLSQHTAQVASNHVSILVSAVNDAKTVAEYAEKASSEVANQLASQSSMVGQAKARLDALQEQLKDARVDYEATKEAALKASSSASEAQANASQAGARATIELHESVSNTDQGGGGHSYEESHPQQNEHGAIIEVPSGYSGSGH